MKLKTIIYDILHDNLFHRTDLTEIELEDLAEQIATAIVKAYQPKISNIIKGLVAEIYLKGER